MLLKRSAHPPIDDIARGDVDEVGALDLSAESRTQRRQFHLPPDHGAPIVNTVRRALSSRGHACSTSESRTGVVAILKPAGAAARSTPSMASTKRSKGMLPMPLPI